MIMSREVCIPHKVSESEERRRVAYALMLMFWSSVSILCLSQIIVGDFLTFELYLIWSISWKMTLIAKQETSKAPSRRGSTDPVILAKLYIMLFLATLLVVLRCYERIRLQKIEDGTTPR